MNLDQHITSILEKIKKAENYLQVEEVIMDSVGDKQDSEYGLDLYFIELEKAIEDLSPLELNSTQFSCSRYALIFLRSLSKEIKPRVY